MCVTPERGTAVEIVYATGGVEPVRWAKVASVIRDRIIDICYCEGGPSPRAMYSCGSMIERFRRVLRNCAPGKSFSSEK